MGEMNNVSVGQFVFLLHTMIDGRVTICHQFHTSVKNRYLYN